MSLQYDENIKDYSYVINPGFHRNCNWAQPFGVQGQTFSNQFFEVLNQISRSGGKIFFDLDRVNIDLAKKGVGTFLEAAENKLVTEWELHQILNSKDFLKNTIFHENGIELTAEQLAKKGIKL